MLLCYVDESGDTATLPTSTSNIQPLFCILGLAIGPHRLPQLTSDFLELKRKYFPGKFTRTASSMEAVLVELKGADLRKNLREGCRDVRRHHLRFLDDSIRLLEIAEARIFGRIWIKAIGIPNNDRSLYTSSVQHICRTYNMLLQSAQEDGMVIADARTQAQNRAVSFSIFTQKFQRAGDAYPRLAEMPTFGHSENHVGLQLADLLVSAVFYPLASYVYCTGHVSNVHVHANYGLLRTRFGSRLQALQYRFMTAIHPATWEGGLVVSDPLGRKGTQHLFQE